MMSGTNAVVEKTGRMAFEQGLSLIEVLVALSLGALLILALNGLVGQALYSHKISVDQNDLTQQAHYAMQQMTRAIRRSPRLLTPQHDKSSSDWRENVREQTVPASAPEGSSTKATAVLTIIMDPTVDLDADGIADADNDGDGLIDEDLPDDSNNDDAPGVYGLDDGGNGVIDEFLNINNADDDESQGLENEDPINSVDDDSPGDNNIDEDPPADMNADGQAGIAGVDDDKDGAVDEGDSADDDEDGAVDEDWYDTVSFYLVNNSLIQRIAVPWDENSSGPVNGRDFIEKSIADNVTRFRVERIALTNGDNQLVDLILELTSMQGSTISLNARVRVGGDL